MAGHGTSGLWVRGFVELTVRCEAPGDFLNALLRAGIGFRRARLTQDRLRVIIGLAAVRRIRPAAFACRARVRIGARGGLPFLLARVRRRPALVGAVALAALALYIASGFVWFVHVEGADRVSAAAVARAAARLGLHAGVFRSRIDAPAIGRRLPALLPDLSFATVSLHGTLATISVAERLKPGSAVEQANVPGDVVAVHAGIVTGIAVTAGKAAVAAGATVDPGQVLISGLTTVPLARGRGSGPSGLGQVPVHAAGIVMARQWYEAVAEAPLTVEVSVPTGRTISRPALQIGPWRLNLFRPGPVPFAAYLLDRQVAGPMRWRGVRLPFELVTAHYAEVSRHLRHLGWQDARDLALAEARGYLLRHLPAGSRIIAESTAATSLPGDRVRVELWVESEDNIGVFRPAAVGDPSAAPPGGGP